MNWLKHLFKRNPNRKPHTLKEKIRRVIRYMYLKIVKARMTPHQVSLGFAIGAFIGIFPTAGFGLILIVFLSGFFRFSVPASVVATLIANPFLAPFWTFLSYTVGNMVIHFDELSALFQKNNPLIVFLTKTLRAGINWLVGNIIISTAVSFVSYFIVKGVIIFYRYEKERIGHKPLKNSLHEIE